MPKSSLWPLLKTDLLTLSLLQTRTPPLGLSSCCLARWSVRVKEGLLWAPKPSTGPSLGFGPQPFLGAQTPGEPRPQPATAVSAGTLPSTRRHAPLQEEVSCFVPKSLRTELATRITLRVVITVLRKCHCMAGKSSSPVTPQSHSTSLGRLSENFVISLKPHTS